MTNLVYPLAVLGASVGVLALRMNTESSLAQRQAETWRHALEAQGLNVTGDLQGEYELDVVLDGETVRLERCSTTMPGPGEQPTVSVSRVTVRVAASITLLVCQREDEASLLGPVPAVPRTPTGDADFDRAYGCFLTPSGAPDGYRDPSKSPIAWAVPTVLLPLSALGLRWMQARDGVLSVAFLPLHGDDPRRGMELAAAIARALRGEAPGVVSAAPREDAPLRARPRARNSLYAALAASVSVGPVLGIGLAFSGLLRPLFEAEVCRPGEHLQITESSADGGTSYGMICAGATYSSADGYVAICMFVSAALLFALAAANSLRPMRYQR